MEFTLHQKLVNEWLEIERNLEELTYEDLEDDILCLINKMMVLLEMMVKTYDGIAQRNVNTNYNRIVGEWKELNKAIEEWGLDEYGENIDLFINDCLVSIKYLEGTWF